MKPFALIPARMESTRFPGKPLARIDGIPMIQRVYNTVSNATSLPGCSVCTDSPEIISFCRDQHIPVIETSRHSTGTDRVLEAAELINAELIINVQGDEPLLNPEFLHDFSRELSNRVARPDSDNCVILAAYCSATKEEASDLNIVKCMISATSKAASFSRLPICSAVLDGVQCYYKQIGIYGYTIEALRRFGTLGKSALEDSERIELMRWIDHVGQVQMVRSYHPAYSVDTIEDLIKVERLVVHKVYGKLS